MTTSELDSFCCAGLSFRSCGKIDLGIIEDVCPVCGKKYSRTTQHGWKLGTNKHQKFFCSHHCMRIVETEKEQKAKKKAEAAIERDLAIVAKEDRPDLTPEEKKEIKNAKARLLCAMQKKGMML